MNGVAVRLVSGLIFGITEAGLVRWLLFSSERINKEKQQEAEIDSSDERKDAETELSESSVLETINQVPAEVDHSENIQIEKSGAILFGSRKSKLFLLAACSILSVLSGYRAAQLLDVCGIAKILVAMIGISACMLVDLYTLLIPNRYIVIMAVARLIILPFELFIPDAAPKVIILNSTIGLIGSFIVLSVMAIISRKGIGMGDVKLLSVTGFLCGFYLVMNTVIYGLIICVIVSLAMVGYGKLTMKMKVPFGPFIYIGFVITVLLRAF